ncbi:MAG: fibronectin type III domain-containing protein [Phycisphaerales bacterium]|nr:MAG: fibronectin type III domain-containing protein [Phycisphaerales bacterium]
MGTYPTSPRLDFLQWCKTHADVFTNSAAAIGLSPASAASFSAAYDAARAAVDDQDAAREAAKAATQEALDKVRALMESASQTVSTIRVFAESTNNPTVYNVAQINPPQPHTAIPAPNPATDLSATLDAISGNITIRWKATQPLGAAGTTYSVLRRAAGQADFVNLGSTRRKSFVDEGFFAGPDSVEYKVQVVRGGIFGPVSATLFVTFGRVQGSGQGFTISSTTSSDEEYGVAA